jgi:pimeloyl-ACP methyl ester carboxylesterase
VIVGHDWGAVATYAAADHEPDRWRRVVTMAVPPAGALAAGLLQYRQLQKSWYMFFFQQGLADVVVGMDDFAFIDGDHTFEAAIQDIIHWSSKVKQGGMIAVHDYCAMRYSGVVFAVDAYTRSHHIDPWFVTRETLPTAFWLK